jgi:hypothetical protein
MATASTAYSGARARPMAGWIVFAATMLLVIGSIDFFEGLIAVIRKQYYVLTPNQIVVFNMTTWGWLTLLWGIVLFLAGLALWSGAGWARWFTIVACSINVLGQLAWLGLDGLPALDAPLDRPRDRRHLCTDRALERLLRNRHLARQGMGGRRKGSPSPAGSIR